MGIPMSVVDRNVVFWTPVQALFRGHRFPDRYINSDVQEQDNPQELPLQEATANLPHKDITVTYDSNEDEQDSGSFPTPEEPSHDLVFRNLEEVPWRYCKGGFHPVHIGDLFSNGRYQVLNKLGYGSFSTVWLVHDHHTSRNVSLKIVSAGHSEVTNELKVLQTITAHNPEDSRSRRVLQLLDHFYHNGPNGRHLCLVAEVLGPKSFCVQSQFARGLDRYSTRQNFLQLLQAVKYLHSCGVVHGDIYPNNIVHRIDDIHTMTIEEIEQRLGKPATQDAYRKDGSSLRPGDPRYTVTSVELAEFVPWEWISPEVVLIDYGGAFFEASPPSHDHITTPRVFTAPETHFRKPITRALDIWGLGHTIFEYHTGITIFGPDHQYVPAYQLEKALGPGAMPQEWVDELTSKGKLNDNWKNPEGYHQYTLTEILDDVEIPGVEKDEIPLFEEWLRLMLTVDPSQRGSLQDIYKHPFFAKKVEPPPEEE